MDEISRFGRRETVMSILFWLMVMASFALIFAVAVLPDCRRSMVLQHKLAEMERANGELARRVKRFEREKLALQNDPFYIEKLARRMFGVQRPGETIVPSVVPGYRTAEPIAPLPDRPPRSILVEVMERLRPLATNQTVRVVAVVLALVNLLAAFLLFGHAESTIPIRKLSY